MLLLSSFVFVCLRFVVACGLLCVCVCVCVCVCLLFRCPRRAHSRGKSPHHQLCHDFLLRTPTTPYFITLPPWTRDDTCRGFVCESPGLLPTLSSYTPATQNWEVGLTSLDIRKFPHGIKNKLLRNRVPISPVWDSGTRERRTTRTRTIITLFRFHSLGKTSELICFITLGWDGSDMDPS